MMLNNSTVESTNPYTKRGENHNGGYVREKVVKFVCGKYQNEKKIMKSFFFTFLSSLSDKKLILFFTLHTDLIGTFAETEK